MNSGNLCHSVQKYLLIARLFAEGFFAIFRENPIIISRKFIRFYFYCMKEEQHFFLYISCTKSDLKNTISSKIFSVEKITYVRLVYPKWSSSAIASFTLRPDRQVMTNLSPTTSPFGGLENPYLALKLTSSNTKASLTSDTVEWITYYLFAHSTSDGFWVTKVGSGSGLGWVWVRFGSGLSRVWVEFVLGLDTKNSGFPPLVSGFQIPKPITSSYILALNPVGKKNKIIYNTYMELHNFLEVSQFLLSLNDF